MTVYWDYDALDERCECGNLCAAWCDLCRSYICQDCKDYHAAGWCLKEDE
ncbi:MAG: hypothetical protein QMD66_06740 [Actinomycetota bacterium]|jgi:hypothetical protein|nr:hypothetical protein [Actinomycetota bacterium]